jgi:hypothetical protein
MCTVFVQKTMHDNTVVKSSKITIHHDGECTSGWETHKPVNVVIHPDYVNSVSHSNYTLLKWKPTIPRIHDIRVKGLFMTIKINIEKRNTIIKKPGT